MAYEDSSYDPQIAAQLWNQYYSSPQTTPEGFMFNENQAMANALRGYGNDPYLSPATYMPGYEDTLTRKLLEKNAAGTTTPTTTSKTQSSMPNMNMMQGLMGGSGFAPSAAAATPGSAPMDFGAGFGTTGGSVVNAGASSAPMGAMDFAGSSAAGSSGGGLMDFGSSFGSTGSSTVAPGTAAAGAEGGGWMSSLGMGGGGTGAAYAGAAGGALGGYLAGRENYKNDPNMWNQKDGFGTKHKDYRAEVGGGTLGGVMGYFGGPIGGALAYPAVKAVHPIMEKGTRGVINFGDKIGGAGGAMMLDPIGTMASGKYSWGDIGKGALLGPRTEMVRVVNMQYDPSMPQSSMPLQMYPQESMMGNAQYNQLMNAQQVPQQPMQDPMQQYMEQMRQQKAMQMMGQGIANMGKGMQQPMPSGNTAQIMRDQNQFRYAGTPQQQMAQALRRR